jgi:hypothetical protein
VAGCVHSGSPCVHTGIMSKFVTMRWPEGLAEQVDAVAGSGGRSGFVVAAVQAALDRAAVPAVAELPKAQAVAGTAPRVGDACRRCGSSTEYAADPRRTLTCTCGHRFAEHR